jgi:hypothetical protein
MSYNPHARNSDPDTSHLAADMTDKLAGSVAVLQAVHALGGNATASEVGRHFGCDYDKGHQRMSDCHQFFHWLLQSDEKRRSVFTNRPQRVHYITPAGYKALKGF